MQNYKNHARLLPFWHFFIPLVWLALLIGCIMNVLHTDESNDYSAALLLVVVFLLGVFYWYIRAFALRAQDRAIRAEESLRYFVLTGKRLNGQLRMGQIIALRFASDEEFPQLAERALAENLGNKEIKQAVRQWREDHNRV